MDFMDAPEQGHSFIEDNVDDLRDTPSVQNLDPLKAQAAMLALTNNALLNAQDAYIKMVNGPKPTIDEVTQQTITQAESSLNEMKTVLPTILSDPNVSADEKFKLVDAVRNNRLKAPDVAQRLHAASVSREHGGDDYTDKVIIKGAARLSAEALEQWQERQAVVNAATAAHDGTLKKVSDFIGLFAPMGEGYQIARVAASTEGAKAGVSGILYSAMLPGSSFAEFHKKFHALSYDEQTTTIKELTDIIQQSSSLMTSDNQMRAASFLADLQNPEYSNFSKYFSNSMNILDAVGIGQLIRATPALLRAGKSVAKGAVERFSKDGSFEDELRSLRESRDIPLGDPTLVDQRLSDAVYAQSQKTQPTDLATITSRPQMNANAKKIQELESQYKSLLEEQLTPLDKGEVTRLIALREQLAEKLKQQPPGKVRQANAVEKLKDRNKDLSAQIRRIDDALDQNSIAQRNIEQISSIEKELSSLRGEKAMVDVPKTETALAVQRAFMQGTVFTHNPRTAGNIIMNANPTESRMLHAAVTISEGDEMAKSLYGVTKNEAIVKNLAPQVGDETGRVKFITPDIEQNLRRSIINGLDNTVYDPDSGLRFTEAERAAGRAKIVEDYSSAVGVKLHPAMATVESELSGSKVRINAVYAAGDSGWLTAEDAIKQTEFALRSRGVTKNDITVLMRDGDEFVPVDPAKVVGQEGEFLARVTADEYIDLDDIKDFEALDVKRNFLDRFFGTGTNRFGSLQSHALPISDMLHPTLVGPAVVADDKVSLISEALLRKLDSFSAGYMKLPKDRREFMKNYIEEANVNEIAFNRANLSARGFDEKEIDMLSTWTEFWDIDWKLENLDLIRSLNAQGFQWMDHPNFQGAVKPRPKNYAITEVYDAMADVVRPIDRSEIDQIYAMGGSIGELKRPLDINGSVAEYVISRNNASEFTRKLTPSDNILERRDGYYQVYHKAPKFIDETFKAANGKTYTRTIATTGTTKEAKDAVELLIKRNPDKTYTFRGDERSIDRGSREYWDLNTAGGRIAQRHRSDLIQNNVGLSAVGAQNYVENPVEAALKATASISGRTAMRPVLEAAKERFMRQYGHLVVQSQPGVRTFPDSLNQIIKKGEYTTKELADARTTWNYISYLESGYVNSVDDLYKNAMRLLGDAAGSKGWGTVERAIREAGEWNPTHAHKGMIFSAYLASNPFRQFIVQSNQGLRAFAYNPQGFTSGSVYNYFMAPFKEAFGVGLTKEQEGFAKFMKNTGMYQAVSKNNLIRGTLLEASEKSSRAGAVASQAGGALRRIGFDQGERFNLLSHAASVYDEFARAGRKLDDARVQAEMHDRVRAITLDMNFAGDMPYNQNALSLLMTYMQVPHKAIAANLSRRIPVDARARMVLFDLAMWGLPTQTIGKILDLEGITPEDPQARRIVEEGLQAWYLNQVSSMISGEDIKVDYSSLSPMSIDNWTKMFGALWFDGGIAKMFDSTAGSKIFGLGMDSRLGVALNMSAQFFKDFYEHPDNPTDLVDVLDSWARISSGWNNFQRARMQWAMGVAKDKYGVITDSSVHKAEAVGQFFGFGSEDTRNYYKVLDGLRKSNKAVIDLAKEDVNKFIQLSEVRTNGMNDNITSLRMHSKMMMSTTRFISPMQRDLYIKEVSDRLMNTPESTMWKEISKSMGFPDNNQVIDNIRRAPGLTEEQKAKAEAVFTQNRAAIQQMRKEDK